MKTYDVVALGELLIDFTENGMSAQGNPILEANPGGAPCNVLAMLQNLDRKTAFIGKVGDDNFGHTLAETVKEQGVDIKNLLFDKEVHTTLAFVHTAPDGDRSFSFYRNPGADMMIRKEDIDESLLADTKLFHFGTLSMTDSEVAGATKFAVAKAKEAGAIISFDPNLRPPLWKTLEEAADARWWGIGQCNVLKISDDEIEFLTGEKEIDAGIAKIIEKAKAEGNENLKLVCASMGKDGSKAFYEGRIVIGKPFPRENTIETTGAGDTFMACVLNGVLENGLTDLTDETLTKILTFANAAASLITTKKGALRVMPTKAEVEAEIG